MRASYKNGFTIIEVVLFLGITGLLVMGILIGSGNSINYQRYRDSVTSLKSMLQKQYSDVSTVSNDRPANWSCDSSAQIVQNDSDGLPAGQSDCVILGKFISSIDSSTILIKDVVGYGSSVSGLNDLALLQSYSMRTSPINTQTYQVEWGSTLSKPGGNEAASFAVLILKSPGSGVVRTFISPNTGVNESSLDDLVDEGSLEQSLLLCVDSSGASISNSRLAVGIKANSTGPIGVEVVGEALNEC